MSFIGVLIALTFIIAANLIEGGHPSALLNLPALLIVLGGTLGAVCVQFPFTTLKDVKQYFSWLVKPPQYDYIYATNTLLQLSSTARKSGLLVVSGELEDVKEPFIVEAFTLMVDGIDGSTLVDVLDNKIAAEEERLSRVAKFYEAMGGYSPTMGILGAVLGLIHAMGLLDKPEELGHGISVAFIATIYGVAFANVLFLPLASRYKLFNQERVAFKEMIVDVAYNVTNGITNGISPLNTLSLIENYAEPHKPKG